MGQQGADPVREVVARAGTFSVQLVSRTTWHYDEAAKLPAHEEILRPLLSVSTECWAYGVTPSGAVYQAASAMLERARGKYRVCLEGDPIGGRELFWNASGGKRGTIVMIVPRHEFDSERIFRGGHAAYVTVNFRSGHTPAAIRFARQRVESSDVIAVCLPRNNGIEWMDIHVARSKALDLFDAALRICGPW